MAKFMVDFWLDGYDNEEDMAKACEEVLKDFEAGSSSISVEPYKPEAREARLVELLRKALESLGGGLESEGATNHEPEWSIADRDLCNRIREELG